MRTSIVGVMLLSALIALPSFGQVAIDVRGNVAVGTTDTPSDLNVAGSLRVGSSIANPHPKFRMQVKGGNAPEWKGAIAAGGDATAVVLGELNGVPTIGAHTGDLNAWTDLTVFSNLRLNGKLFLKAREVGFGLYPYLLMSPASGEVTKSESDQRLKTDIQTIPNALDTIRSLRGVSYRWNEEGLKQKTAHVEGSMISESGSDADNQKLWGKENQRIRKENSGNQRGFIAQEVEQVFPEWVKTGDNGYKSINMSELNAVLVEAVKQQQQMIDQLKTENVEIKQILCQKVGEGC